MPQSLSSILIHLIFSTKNREPFITRAIEPELHPYMAAVFRALKSPSLAIDGTTDHVHILFSLGRIMTIADVVEEVKTESSKWIKTKGREFRNFHWQKGYGAFSIGQSNLSELKRYIRSQKEHHRITSTAAKMFIFHQNSGNSRHKNTTLNISALEQKGRFE